MPARKQDRLPTNLLLSLFLRSPSLVPSTETEHQLQSSVNPTTCPSLSSRPPVVTLSKTKLERQSLLSQELFLPEQQVGWKQTYTSPTVHEIQNLPLISFSVTVTCCGLPVLSESISNRSQMPYPPTSLPSSQLPSLQHQKAFSENKADEQDRETSNRHLSHSPKIQIGSRNQEKKKTTCPTKTNLVIIAQTLVIPNPYAVKPA